MLDIGRPPVRPEKAAGSASETHTIQTQPPQAFSSLTHAAMIGNFPPRQCGIATFTRDILNAIAGAAPDAKWQMVALNDERSSHDYPDRVTQILPQNDVDAYLATADTLNRSGAQVAFIQHEFGIFGGPAGEHLLALMRRLKMPIIVTLHTVLERPNPDQRRVMDEILRLSSAVVVMTEKGADILQRVHNAGASKVHVVPHGAPERPFSSTERFKAAIGLAGRKTIMTFGLLSPNKGLETVIRALPAVLEQQPDTTYMIVGATHPHLVAHEGEVYRDSLIALARNLGVEKNLHFVNRYLSDPELIDLLQAADVYATPYLTEAQITSGTLSYAIALGKPVVSTPYWHAAEALADGVGVVCPFGDSEAFGRELADLLSNDMRREHMARRAYKAGTPSRWSNIGKSYLDLASAARLERRGPPAQPLRKLARPSLSAVRRLFDETGMFQHAKFRVPDRTHGYCIDDNARALALFAQLNRDGDHGDNEARLAYTVAGFVNHAWNEKTGRFRNFMDYGRNWLDDGGCDDSQGRTFEAICLTARYSLREDLRDWAIELGRRVWKHAGEWTSLRAQSHVLRGAISAEGVILDPREVRDYAENCREAFESALKDGWYEDRRTYDNARLCEGHLNACSYLGDAAGAERALTTLMTLMQDQTTDEGFFRPVPTHTWRPDHGDHSDRYDQQPLEAQACIDACYRAYRVTEDDVWINHAIRAFLWYGGDNDQHCPLITREDGGCYDGLTRSGPNKNQGAESVLAYHLAAASMRRLIAARPERADTV